MSWQAGPHSDDPVRPPVVVAESELRRPAWRAERPALRPRADTGLDYVLALLPSTTPLLGLASVLFAGGWSLSTVGMLAVAVGAVQFLVARRDRHRLGERGFVDRAPATLALVSPILYLAVRARCSTGHDPDTAQPIRWAIAATVASGVALAVITWFFAAIGEGLVAVSGG